MCRDLKMRLYGRAILYTGASGQMVKEANVTENFKAGESENNTDYYNSLCCTVILGFNPPFMCTKYQALQLLLVPPPPITFII